MSSSPQQTNPPLRLSPDKAQQVKALTRVPRVAWPTVGFWLVAVLGVPAVDVLVLQGHLSYPLAALCNIALMYPLFGVIHDATHRAISSNGTLSDWIGRIALLVIAPHGMLGLFRWAHMQHHRFTNGDKDPDHYVRGAWWTLPVRWMTFDIGYLFHIARKGDAISRKHMKRTLLATVALLAVIAVLVNAGYGREVLWLWLIPSRVTMGLFGFVFFWLPHVKHDVTAQEDVTLASTVRLGHESWLGPVLQFHNLHLLHHLYPSMPPYNHPKLWKLIEPELRQQRNLAVQHGLGLAVTVEPARGAV